jgi:hypothetical protein
MAEQEKPKPEEKPVDGASLPPITGAMASGEKSDAFGKKPPAEK